MSNADYSGTAMEALRAGGFGANAEAYQASRLRDLIAELRVQASIAYGTDVAASVLIDAADALEQAEARVLLAYSEGFSEGFKRAAGRPPRFSEMRSYPGMNGIPVTNA